MSTATEMVHVDVEELAQTNYEKMQSNVSVMVERARALTVIDSTTCQQAIDFRNVIKDKTRVISEAFDPLIKSAHETHKRILSLKKKATEPLDQADTIAKDKVLAYRREEEERRRLEEARLQAEAQKKAEEMALAQAAELERGGNIEDAERLINEPVQAPVVVLSREKMSGASFRKEWKFRIKDESKIPREYLTVDEKAIRRVVAALKDKANIPGVEIYEEETMVRR